MVKHGRIKRQHGRVAGLDALLDRIIAGCPHVSRAIPGRISRKRPGTAKRFTIQYATGSPATGLKCLYITGASVQEVFLVSSNPDSARRWLTRNGLAEPEKE